MESNEDLMLIEDINALTTQITALARRVSELAEKQEFGAMLNVVDTARKLILERDRLVQCIKDTGRSMEYLPITDADIPY